MTLSEFFDYLGANPTLVLAYFILPPLTALMAGWMGRGEGGQSPWKYLYMVLVYLVCIPGIFAAALSIYLFLFERGSIMNTNMYTQVLPLLSMVGTLVLIRRNTDFDAIPGFGKLSSLMLMIGAVFFLMYLLDRTHLIAFVRVHVAYLIAIVLGMLLLFRFALKKFIA
jgi:hypothetical protein